SNFSFLPGIIVTMSESEATPSSENPSAFEAFGPNSGLVEELYRQYLGNPGSVGERWKEFFADYTPRAQRDTRSNLVSATQQTTAPVTSAAARPASHVQAP